MSETKVYQLSIDGCEPVRPTGRWQVRNGDTLYLEMQGFLFNWWASEYTLSVDAGGPIMECHAKKKVS